MDPKLHAVFAFDDEIGVGVVELRMEVPLGGCHCRLIAVTSK